VPKQLLFQTQELTDLLALAFSHARANQTFSFHDLSIWNQKICYNEQKYLAYHFTQNLICIWAFCNLKIASYFADIYEISSILVAVELDGINACVDLPSSIASSLLLGLFMSKRFAWKHGNNKVKWFCYVTEKSRVSHKIIFERPLIYKKWRWNIFLYEKFRAMTVCDTTSKTPIRRVIRNSHSLLKLQGKLYQITLKIIMCTRYWIETHGTPR